MLPLPRNPELEGSIAAQIAMLDVVDFIKERGGDPEKIRESQRRRHAPVEDVDTVITLWGEHQKVNRAYGTATRMVCSDAVRIL